MAFSLEADIKIMKQQIEAMEVHIIKMQEKLDFHDGMLNRKIPLTIKEPES